MPRGASVAGRAEVPLQGHRVTLWALHRPLRKFSLKSNGSLPSAQISSGFPRWPCRRGEEAGGRGDAGLCPAEALSQRLTG